MDPTNQLPGGVLFDEMRVVEVNDADGTLSLVGESPNSTSAVGVPWLSAYCHPDGGGIEAMPEVGAIVWCVWHDNDSLPLVFGFINAPIQGEGFGHNRLGMSPGDVALWTRGNNHVWVKKNGAVQIATGDDCKTIYLPSRSMIQDLCKNYEMQTDGGSFRWIRSEDAKGRCILTLEASRFSGEEASLIVRVGDVKHPELGDILFLVESEGSLLAIDHDGNSTVRRNDVSYRAQSFQAKILGSVDVSVDGGMTVAVGANALIKTSGAFGVEGASSYETYTGTKTIKAAKVALGLSPTHPAVLGDALAEWLATHKHVGAGTTMPDDIARIATLLSGTVTVSR